MLTWKDYFEDLSQSPRARAISSNITEGFFPVSKQMESARACALLKLAAESYSPLLTILAGLELEFFDLASRTKLTIHLVGAGELDIRRACMMEELYHLLPNLQSLIVGYVGPDVRPIHGDIGKTSEFGCCSECQVMNRSPHQAFLADYPYHDFTKSDLFLKYPPDLIVAFHTGQGSIPDWQPTLERILDLGVPALFTTYNEEEALDEEQSFSSMNAHFSKRPTENRWRGRLPKFDLFMERYDVFYSNYYWYIVKGRTQE